MKIVVASKNPDKVAEVEDVLAALDSPFEIVRGYGWDEVEETGATLVANARLKAQAVATATGVAALADDTGLEVDALDGAPGVHTARFAGPAATYADNVVALLAALEGVSERTARFRTVVVLARPDGREWQAEGVLEGAIAAAPRGDGGFGYDPIFDLEGRTLAELDATEKNQLSHRARALQALVAVFRP